MKYLIWSIQGKIVQDLEILDTVTLETGILETGNGGESIRSYYVYSLVLVWGLCADGVVRLAAGVYHRLAPP